MKDMNENLLTMLVFQWSFTFIIVKAGPVGLADIGWRLYIVSKTSGVT